MDELVPAGAMASMESRMEARKSESARCGSTSSRSGDGGGRRGYRRPSGLHRHYPVTVAVSVGVVVAAALPVGQALPLGAVGGVCGSGEPWCWCPGPSMRSSF